MTVGAPYRDQSVDIATQPSKLLGTARNEGGSRDVAVARSDDYAAVGDGNRCKEEGKKRQVVFVYNESYGR